MHIEDKSGPSIEPRGTLIQMVCTGSSISFGHREDFVK